METGVGFFYAEAGWSYTATKEPLWTGDIDISFNKGEKLVVVDNLGYGWLKVDKDNFIGAIPEAYVKKVDWYEAQWDYQVIITFVSS